VLRVELGRQEAGVDGRDDELLELLGVGQVEGGEEGGVAEDGGGRVGRAVGRAREGEERQLAELALLGVVEGGQVGGLARRGPGAVAEDLEEGEVVGVGIAGRG